MITQEAYRARHRVKLADNADAGRRRSANASECRAARGARLSQVWREQLRRKDGNHKLANRYTPLCPGYVDSLDDGSHDVEASGPPR